MGRVVTEREREKKGGEREEGERERKVETTATKKTVNTIK